MDDEGVRSACEFEAFEGGGVVVVSLALAELNRLL